MSPSTVLAMTIVASPDQTMRSAATSSTLSASAIGHRLFWISSHLRSTSSRPPHMKNACSATWS